MGSESSRCWDLNKASDDESNNDEANNDEANNLKSKDADSDSDFSTSSDSHSEHENTYKWNTDFEVSSKSKIAITSGYLLSQTIDNYFARVDNKCSVMNDIDFKKLVASILQNILIQGGAARDLLLEKPINDLDIVCNTRELNKLHLKHLREYHNTKEHQDPLSTCALWQRYLLKFEDETKQYDKKMFAKLNTSDKYKSKEALMKSNEYVRNCSYILNAKYIVDILSESVELKEVLTVQVINRPMVLIFAAMINKKYMFNGMDLDQQDFDIVDITEKDTQYVVEKERELARVQTRANIGMNAINAAAKEEEKKEDLNTTFLKSSLVSIRMDTKYRTLLLPETKSDAMEVSLPICSIHMDQHYSSVDFSINSMVLPLLSVQDVLEGKKEINTAVYNALRAKLETKGKDYNIMNDVEAKLLTATYETVANPKNTYRHFWRTIKFGIRYYDDGWRVNETLIKMYNDLYGKWIDNEQFISDSEMIKIQVKQQFNYGYANDVDEYQKMVKIFDVLSYNEKLKSALNRSKEFKTKWIEALLQKDEAIVNIFKQEGYAAVL